MITKLVDFVNFYQNWQQYAPFLTPEEINASGKVLETYNLMMCYFPGDIGRFQMSYLDTEKYGVHLVADSKRVFDFIYSVAGEVLNNDRIFYYSWWR